jgi:hypothetical protein
MGFASAFATGLVKGFTRNIENEQKARAKDQEKLDGYRALLMKSVLSGDDVNLAAVNSVKDMIKSGEKQLAEQEPIDIFGRPSQRLKLDMFDTAGVINNVGKTLSIGGVDMPVSKLYYDKAIIKNEAARANVFIDSLRNLGPAKVKTLFRTKQQRNALGEFYTTAVANSLRPKLYNEDKTELVAMLGPKNIDINSWMKDIVPVGQSEYDVAISNLNKDSKLGVDEILLPISNQNAVLGKITDLNLNQTEMNSLKGLSNLHGYDDIKHYLYDTASQYKDKTIFYESLKDGIKLFNMNAHEPKSEKEKVAIGKWMSDQKAKTGKDYVSDPILASYLMLPMVHDADMKTMDWLRNQGFREKLKGKGYQDRFFQFTGIKVNTFQKDLRALRRTDGQLKELISLMEKAQLEPDSTVASIFMAFNKIFGDTGYIDQVANLLGASPDSEDAESRAIYSRIQDQIGGLDQGSLLAKQKTLKFIIAADLARAEDEQGRLSDQDLARNLAKLGGAYGTIEDSIDSIKVLQADINKKLLGKQMLNEILTRGMSQGYFTKNQRKLLQADRMAREYLSSYHRTLTGGDTGSSTATSTSVTVTPEDLIKLDDNNKPIFEVEPNYVGADGSAVYVKGEETDNPIYVQVQTPRAEFGNKTGAAIGGTSKIVKQFTASQFRAAIDRGEFFTPSATNKAQYLQAQEQPPMIGGASTDSDQTTNQVPDQVARVVKGSQIQGFDINKMSEYAQPDGIYLLPDGKKYKITDMGNNPTFMEVQ